MTTLAGFEQERTGWGGSGSYTDEPDTGTMHSTEGPAGSFNGTRDYLARKGYQSHVLTEIRAGAPGGRRKCQMVDLDRAAKALRNESGGIQTNKNGTLQVEVIMEAHDPYGLLPGHVPVTEADWLWFGREVIGPLFRAKGVPLVSQAAFHDYPPEGGRQLGREPWRTHGDERSDVVGLIGHMHWIENSHGDPGNWSRKHYRGGTTSALDLILEGATGTPPTDTEDPLMADKLSPEVERQIRSIVKSEVQAQGMITAAAVIRALTLGTLGRWAREGLAYARTAARFDRATEKAIAAEADKVGDAELAKARAEFKPK